jgi:hypothetical protein
VTWRENFEALPHQIREWAHRQPKPARMSIGVALVFGGFLGFLPILGFWMVPLGLIILSVDFPVIRRVGRRARAKWREWQGRRTSARGTPGAAYSRKQSALSDRGAPPARDR